MENKVKCSLCRKEVEEKDLSQDYNVDICKSCARELGHYGSE